MCLGRMRKKQTAAELSDCRSSQISGEWKSLTVTVRVYMSDLIAVSTNIERRTVTRRQDACVFLFQSFASQNPNKHYEDNSTLMDVRT